MIYCKEIILDKIKFEEPVNFGLIFQEMMANTNIERIPMKSSQDNKIMVRMNKSQLKNRLGQKAKAQSINLNKTVVTEHKPKDNYITQNITVELDNPTKLPLIEFVKK